MEEVYCSSKPLASMPAIWLARYDMELTYLKGNYNVMTCALSWFSPLESEAVHHIIPEIPDLGFRLKAAWVASQADPVLSQLKSQIFQGWPEVRRGIKESLYPFWIYQDELSVKDGLMFKTHKLAIPTSQQQEFLKHVCSGYLGEKTLLWAGECIYWPRETEDVKQDIRKCDICQSIWPNQQKDTPIPHYVSCDPWEKVALTFSNTSHMTILVADYCNNFPFIRKLSNQTAALVVNLQKTVFSKYVMPAHMLTDQGRQLVLVKFQEFTRYYHSSLTTQISTVHWV